MHATEIDTRGSTSSDVLNAQARVQSTKAQLIEAEADLDRQQPIPAHRRSPNRASRPGRTATARWPR